jgi:upstream activation factor subunit UAF30
MPKSSKRSKSSSKDRKKEKSKTPKREEPVEEVVEEVVETPVVEKTKSDKKKKSKTTTPAPEVSTETVSEAVTETSADGKRQRRVVTKESVLEDFDQFLQEVEAEIAALREPDAKKNKNTGARFARLVSKRVKGLRADANRVMRNRKQSNRPKNTSSGFMKPVQISSEMSKFTGWEPDVPRSRVDVTKFLCEYIKEKDLQNPEDRRIIRPDNTLNALIKLKGEDLDKPLTYYTMQRGIQHHFTNVGLDA